MKVLIWTCGYTARDAGLPFFGEAKQQGLDVELAGTRRDPTEFLNKFSVYQPDVVFCFALRPELVDVYHQIKNSGVKLVFWYSDQTNSTRNRWWLNHFCGYADCLIFSIVDTAIRYASCAPVSLWMPQYFDADPCFINNAYPKRLDFTKPIYDLVFIGSVDDNRKRLLDGLAKHYSVNFVIDPFNTPREVHGRRMAEIYAQGKIAINIQRAAFKTTAPFVTSNRIYNAIGSGAFYLSHPVRNLELLFDVNHHCAVFDDSTVDTMRVSIDYWLTQDSRREQIANAGQRRVLTYHTLRKRIQEYWLVMQLLLKKADLFQYYQTIYPYLRSQPQWQSMIMHVKSSS